MRKVLHVAGREFAATVLTKGFIIGMLLTPTLLGVLIYAMPRMVTRTPPKVAGEIAVIDPTGEVTAGLADFLRPQRFVERREESRRRIAEATPEALRQVTAAAPGGEAAVQRSLDAALGQVPQLTVVGLSGAADVEQAKAPLKEGAPKGVTGTATRLALVVVHRDAVTRAAGSDRFGSYDLFVRGKVDDRLEAEIREGLREAIVEGRVRASGLDSEGN